MAARSSETFSSSCQAFAPRIPANHNESHNCQRIGIDTVSNEVLMQYNGCHHSSQPQQQSKRAQMHWANIDIGIHTPRCFKYIDPFPNALFALI
jgi:hypothetical protein